jgi:ferric-dicitrate binding protein FerR (iron transport regulator)
MDRFNAAVERVREDIAAMEAAWRDAQDVASSAMANPAPRDPARPTMMQTAAICAIVAIACMGLALFVYVRSL